MKRGEIYYANLNPSIGSEIKKVRPVLVISNDANNKFAATITVIPITSKISKIYPFEVKLSKQDSGLSKDSKAQCHQIRTISKLRISSKSAGKLNREILQRIQAALALHLGF
jgi:mRNA interferase MazF